MVTWLATDGAESGNYRGAWVSAYRVVTIAAIPADALWGPLTNATDNRTDGTGMFLELDLFNGDPGNFAWAHYGSSGAGWDHSDRFVTYTGVEADGTYTEDGIPTSTGVLIPSRTTVYLVAAQFPVGHAAPLPLDAYTNWDPATNTGAWTLADGTTPLVPWNNSDLVELAVLADPPDVTTALLDVAWSFAGPPNPDSETPIRWQFDVTVPGYVTTGTVSADDTDDAWSLDIECTFVVDVEPEWDDTPLIDLISA